MSVDHKTRDAGDLRAYRTEIPNIVFAKLANGEITGEDFVLYCVLKRTAGDLGSSTKATKTLAAEAHIRVADVVAGKRRLINAGLIEVVSVERFAAGLRLGGRPQHVVTITDVWAENMALFAASAKPAPADEQVPPVNLQVPDVELASSAGGTKEENIPPFAKAKDVAATPAASRRSREPKTGPNYGALFAVVRSACKLGNGRMSGKDTRLVSIAARELEAIGISPDEATRAASRWASDDWRGQKGQPPTPPQFVTWATQCRADDAKSAPAPRSDPRGSFQAAALAAGVDPIDPTRWPDDFAARWADVAAQLGRVVQVAS